MRIQVTSGIGNGLTRIAAFDDALFYAGISNFNLICLSSIIPPNSSVIVGKYSPSIGEFGRKLYVVLSCRFEDREGKAVYAGLGWIFNDKGGVFVEHQGENPDEVKEMITMGIRCMQQHRTFLEGEDIHYEIVGVDAIHLPTCALVAAVYTSEDW